MFEYKLFKVIKLKMQIIRLNLKQINLIGLTYCISCDTFFTSHRQLN